MPRSLTTLAASLVLVAGLAPLSALASDSTLPDWADVRTVKVAGGLAGPVDFDFAPDGTIYYVEVYGGNVVHLDPATNTSEVVLHVDSVAAFDERGLVGIAVAPDFATSHELFIFYTKATSDPDGGVNRVSRIDTAAAGGAQETVILDNIPAFKRHNGGRLEFGPDNTLFVAVGDNEKQTVAQDPKSPLGKVLRITRDGKPAPGNFAGTLAYDLGHRNVYGLAYNAKTGVLYETENSGWQRDEVNVIEGGKNYGYPTCEGFSLVGKEEPCPSQYTPPILEFYHTKTAAPTGATWFLGQFFWASWNEGSIHHNWHDDDSPVWKDKVYHTPGGRIADLETGPEGRTVWYSTWDSIVRLEFPSLPPGVESQFMPAGWKAPPRPGATPSPTPTIPGLTGASGLETEKPLGIPAPAWPFVALALAGAAALAARRRR